MSDQKFLSDLVAELGKLNKDDLNKLLQGVTENKQGITTLRAEVDALKGSQSAAPNLYVVASGKSGNTFWKKYNNGLIEQFGWAAPATNANPNDVTVTFSVAFSSTPRLIVTPHDFEYETWDPENALGVKDKYYVKANLGYKLTKTGFKVYSGQSVPGAKPVKKSEGTDWYAIGF